MATIRDAHLQPLQPLGMYNESYHPLPPCTSQHASSTRQARAHPGRTPCPALLPAELHLRIIESLAAPSASGSADLATLCACALVCKLWLHTARARIWATVRLGRRQRSTALLGLLGAYVCRCTDDGDGETPMHEPACGRGRLSLPSFAPYVAWLAVREARGHAWDPKWLDAALPSLCALLPRVHGLELERVAWAHLSAGTRAACVDGLRHARHLALRGCTFGTARELCAFLAGFAALEVLALDVVHCAEADVPGTSGVGPPARGLREVGVRGAPMKAVLEWIMSGAECGMTSVRLGGVGSAEAAVVGRFLRHVGADLTRLRIGFDRNFLQRGEAFMDCIDLGPDTRLQELHIFGLVTPSLDEGQRGAPPLTSLTSLLATIQSPMQVLSLALYPADQRVLALIDFAGLVRVLGRPGHTWARLREVRVVVAGRDGRALDGFVRRRLSALEERGVLRLSAGLDESESI